jgi:hypothetical protein
MIRWDVLLNPQVYAQEIAAHPPLGAATSLLLMLTALLTVLTVCLPDLLIEHKYDRDLRSQFRLWSAVLGIPLLFLALFLVFTFVMLGIERWLGRTLSFEALFCLLVVGIAPKFAVWSTYFVRDISRAALYVWRVFAVLLLLYTTQRLWGTVSAVNHLTVWQTLLTMAPILIGLWVTSIWELCETPDSLRSAFPWQHVGGKRVVVFYPPENAYTEVEVIAREADTLLAQIERILDVKPVAFRVQIFLCRNSEDLLQFKKEKDQPIGGYAGAGYVCLVYGPWPEIRTTVAHELTHVVAKQRLKLYLMPLLNEGLAEYGRAQTVAGSARAGICLSLPLGTLAHSGLFYEWLYIAEPDHSAAAKYAHAGALADYLIGRYGMDKFKELCLQTAYDSSQNQAAQLHTAVTAIYGISLRQLEQDWRREWIGPGQIELETKFPDSR